MARTLHVKCLEQGMISLHNFSHSTWWILISQHPSFSMNLLNDYYCWACFHELICICFKNCPLKLGLFFYIKFENSLHTILRKRYGYISFSICVIDKYFLSVGGLSFYSLQRCLSKSRIFYFLFWWSQINLFLFGLCFWYYI